MGGHDAARVPEEIPPTPWSPAYAGAAPGARPRLDYRCAGARVEWAQARAPLPNLNGSRDNPLAYAQGVVIVELPVQRFFPPASSMVRGTETRLSSP